MMYLNIDTDPQCVPYLSDAYIDTFCNDLIKRFEPSAITQLHPVNIEQFTQRFKGLRLRYEYLSCDGSILGAALFSDTDSFPIFNAKKRQAEYTSAAKGTVFIDKSLTCASKNNRYRFTLAHEAGHMLWHAMYFAAKQKSMSKARNYLTCTNEKITTLSDAHDRTNLSSAQLIEYQANRTASALLMPKEAVFKLISSMGNCTTQDDAIDRVIFTASLFRVSDAAARIRLTELGLIDPELLRTGRRRRRSA